jgi:hypothetical protein
MRFLIAVLLATLLAACGGDDNDTPTPTPTTSGTATVKTSSGSEKSPTPQSSEPSPAVSAPGGTPTAPPVSAIGTPAPAPADQQAFSTSFAGQQVDQRDCLYNPGTGVVNCQSVLYAIDPPMVGQDITCTLWVVSGAPRAIACHAEEPPGTTYYEIKG